MPPEITTERKILPLLTHSLELKCKDGTRSENFPAWMYLRESSRERRKRCLCLIYKYSSARDLFLISWLTAAFIYCRQWELAFLKSHNRNKFWVLVPRISVSLCNGQCVLYLTLVSIVPFSFGVARRLRAFIGGNSDNAAVPFGSTFQYLNWCYMDVSRSRKNDNNTAFVLVSFLNLVIEQVDRYSSWGKNKRRLRIWTDEYQDSCVLRQEEVRNSLLFGPRRKCSCVHWAFPLTNGDKHKWAETPSPSKTSM